MKKFFTIAAAFTAALSSYAQGVHFEHKTLEQAIAQAKKEHKQVFINCCMQGGKPCIFMNEKVFPVKAAGDYYNAHYVNLSVDMELLPVDDAARAQRALADTLRHRYRVNGYPNLLFIDTDGKLLHRFIGSMTPDAFVQLGKDAQDPQKQFYAQIAAFKAGHYDSTHLRQLAIDAFNFGDSETAHALANTYLQHKTDAQLANPADIGLYGFALQNQERASALALLYWQGLTPAQRLQPEAMHLLLLQRDHPDTIAHYADLFVTHSPDSVLLQRTSLSVLVQAAYQGGTSSKPYQYLWQHRAQTDSVFEQPISMIKLFSSFMSKQIVVPYLQQAAGNPDWEVLRQQLTAASDATYADRVLLQTRMGAAGQQKDWPTAIAMVVAIDKKYGSARNGYEINQDLVQPILARSSDATTLQYALDRMAQVVNNQSPSAGQVSNYAMLLYNTGHKTDAIRWEKIALETEPNDKNFATTLDQMTNGTLVTIKP